MLLLLSNIVFIGASALFLFFLFSLFLVLRKDAPWMPTPLSTVRTMLQMARVGEGDVVVDLGCGDGRVLFSAIRDCGAQSAIGYEINPFFIWWIRARARFPRYRGKVMVRRTNLFSADLSNASTIFCYLLQTTNEKLEEKLMRECAPGTRIVSRAFSFPHLTLVSEKTGRTKIRLYKIV